MTLNRILPIFTIGIAALNHGLADSQSALVDQALKASGKNRAQIAEALEKAPDEQKSALQFLIAYMPKHDLEALSAKFLLNNVDLAFKARASMPWGNDIPDARFLNDVLPYASINERRDDWRADFYERLAPIVKDCKTPGEAAQALNRDLYKLIGVQYHASKRPKPDQSPYESIEAKYASCSGLSVLLIDACRAVCVPARFAGTARWAKKRGNHSWVEVWDSGKWHFTGACEYNKAGLNKVWFLNDASHAKKDERRHAIYATSWQHTGESFPMVWAQDLDYVQAINVTDIYTGRAAQLLSAGECLLGIQVWDCPGGERVVSDVRVRAGEEKIHEGKTTGTSDDTNHVFEVVLKQNKAYSIDYVDTAGEQHSKPVTTANDAHQRLDLFLSEK